MPLAAPPDSARRPFEIPHGGGVLVAALARRRHPLERGCAERRAPSPPAPPGARTGKPDLRPPLRQGGGTCGGSTSPATTCSASISARSRPGSSWMGTDSPTRSTPALVTLSSTARGSAFSPEISSRSRRKTSPVFVAVYDRAALVALPAPTRQRYARHLASLLEGPHPPRVDGLPRA